ncbi:syndecan-2-like [Notolabrus celidotus]|uniref:syndecan-2-like n=1 Tax=Notolabrus celidotus TaxID=1203425 RepID=UPI0014904F08|nr:syndecan-2-like [Notolabrus celidotus]
MTEPRCTTRPNNFSRVDHNAFSSRGPSFFYTQLSVFLEVEMRNLRLLFLVGLATGFIGETLFVSSQSPISTADDLYIEGLSSGDLLIDDDDDEDREDEDSGSGSGDYGLGILTDQDEQLRKFLNLSMTTVSKDTVSVQPQPTAGPPPNPQTTAEDSQGQLTTVEVTETPSFKLPDEDRSDEKVPGISPTADFSTLNTSPSPTSTPLRDTTSTKLGIEISVSTDAGDNSLDNLDVSSPKGSEDVDKTKEEDNEIVAKDGRGSRMYDMDAAEEVSSENMWERTEVLAAVIACGVVGLLCAVFLLLLLGYRMKKKDEGSYELGDVKLSSTTYHKAPTKEFYA